MNRNTRLDSLRGEMLLHLVRPIILPIKQDEEVSVSELFKATYAQIKRLINPITPPNYDVEQATLLLLKGEGVNVPPTCLRTKPPLQQYGQLRAAQSRGRRRPKRI
jgi:poly(A) polymerase